MASEKYDPNAHRPEYLQAFDEFKQRGSLYNQLIIREERQESGSRTPNTPTDQSNSNGAQHDQSEAMKQRSLPNKMSRSVFSPSTQRKSKTANNTLAVNENNNSIYVNEILEFEDNCINDESFGGATNQSPPKTFYRNNSNPFSPNAQKSVKVPFESSSVPMQSEFKSPAKASKIEQSRQRACKKLLSYVQPKAKSETSSNSSGAYRSYDLDSSVDAEGELKISNGRSIPLETYNEIANAFGDFTQRNGVYEVRDKHNNSQNSSVSQPNDHGFSSPSALNSYRRCEGVIDENFRFLNDTKWNHTEESELNNHGGSNIQVTDLDESAGRLSEYGKSIHQISFIFECEY